MASKARGVVTPVDNTPASMRTQSRRVREGLRRARALGIRLGRPPAVVDLQRLRSLRGKGMSIRAIANKLNVSKTTVADILNRL